MRDPLVQPAPTIARINVTPIIDVALVLVIILLITAPMITNSNMDVDLPAAQTRAAEDEVRMSVTMGVHGELAINENTVPAKEFVRTLAARLAESSNKNILVVVRADAGMPYDSVNHVLKLVRKAGAMRVAIATRQREKKS
ncbi:MAG: biopolymer transporter ExbD [Candidatus Krumholzibacteria bacterium]